MRARDLDRFEAEINKDFVVVPVNNEMVAGPKWDIYENNHFAMRKRLVNIFLKVANKLIIRMRAGKRLKQMKKKFEEFGVTNREQCK